MKNKTKLCGQEGFNQFYSDLFGPRWEALKESFFQENQSVEYKIQNLKIIAMVVSEGKYTKKGILNP